MFLVQLRFSVNKPQAGAWMDDHKAWLQQGFDAGVFLVSGNLQPQAGGAILAHNTSPTIPRSRTWKRASPRIHSSLMTW